MNSSIEKQVLSSRIIKTEEVKWKSFKFLQQDEFKDLPSEAKAKLRKSILTNKFTQPFYVWQDKSNGEIFCLDGKHRTIILEELIKEGFEIPELLPATFIDCQDKKDAAALVLTYSSIYAKVIDQGLYDFISMYELEYNSLKEMIDIPGLSLDKYEQRFDQFTIEEDEGFELPAKIVVKEGDLFQINGHRIICDNSRDQQSLNKLMEGRKISLVFTSPPYNMNGGLYAEYEDSLEDKEYLELNMDIINNLLDHLSGYLFYNISYNRNSRTSFIDILSYLKNKKGIQFLELIVWNKKTAMPISSEEMLTRTYEQVAVISTDDMLVDMEIYYLGSNKRKVYFNKRIGKTMSNYWEIPVTGSKVQFDDHKACFPLELPARAIQLTTKEEEIICDPFLGMGTTLLSSDILGRICYGIEMQPAYVQGSIERYIRHCQQKGKPINFKHINGSLKLKDFSNGKSRSSEKNNRIPAGKDQQPKRKAEAV